MTEDLQQYTEKLFRGKFPGSRSTSNLVIADVHPGPLATMTVNAVIKSGLFCNCETRHAQERISSIYG